MAETALVIPSKQHFYQIKTDEFLFCYHLAMQILESAD